MGTFLWSACFGGTRVKLNHRHPKNGFGPTQRLTINVWVRFPTEEAVHTLEWIFFECGPICPSCTILVSHTDDFPMRCFWVKITLLESSATWQRCGCHCRFMSDSKSQQPSPDLECLIPSGGLNPKDWTPWSLLRTFHPSIFFDLSLHGRSSSS